MATLYDKLIAAGLPVASATEAGLVDGMPGVPFTEAQRLKLEDILLEHFQPAVYADLLIYRADKTQLATEAQATITTLQNFEAVTNPTNAQVIAAVKFLAKTLRLILKFIVRQYK